MYEQGGKLPKVITLSEEKVCKKSTEGRDDHGYKPIVFKNKELIGMSLEINSATVLLSHEAIHLMKFSYLHQLDVRVWEERGTIGMIFLKPGSPTL